MQGADAARRSILRRLALSLVLAVVLALLLEGAAGVLLAWWDSGDVPGIAEESHCAFDAELGWVNRKGVRVPDLYGPGLDLSTNSLGFRGREEYTPAVPAGRVRIVCLGDSFTLGYGVGDESTYPAQLEALEPRIQAVDMGQGGYGIDQCFLWYLRDGTALASDVLLLAFIAPDFERMLDERFQGTYPKPRLRVEDGKLVRPTEPLPADWESGRGLRRVRRFGSALAVGEVLRRVRRRVVPREAEAEGALPYRELAELVLDELARVSRERGQVFALALLPLRDPREARPPAFCAWLEAYAAVRGVPWIDLAAEFERLPPGERAAAFLADGHLNAAGNRIVAERLLGRLRAVVPALR